MVTTNAINQTPQELNASDKANLLTAVLAEYSAREDEKNAVAQGIGNLVAIAVGVIGGLFAIIFSAGQPKLLAVVPSVILVFLIMESDREFSILYQSLYIELLEERLNRMIGLPAMQWARRGSSYHQVLRKPVLRTQPNGRGHLNWALLPKVLFAFVVLSLFFSSLYLAIRLLKANGGVAWQATAVWAYAVAHIVLLLIVAVNRFCQHPKVLKLLRHNLCDELFSELESEERSDIQ